MDQLHKMIYFHHKKFQAKSLKIKTSKDFKIDIKVKKSQIIFEVKKWDLHHFTLAFVVKLTII